MNINWLKLDVNILNDSKIKMIRKYPAGNDLVILWLGIICLAMKSDNTGYVYIADGIPYTNNELAMELDLEEKTVELGLGIFKRFRMIDITDGGAIEIINFNKHQQIDKIEKHREYNRIRQAEYRDRKRNALLTHDLPVSNAIDKITTDKIRLDKTKKDNNIYIDEIKEIMQYFNKTLGKKFQVVEKNTKHIRTRLNEGFTVDDFKRVIDNKKLTPFFNKNPVYFRPETIFGPKFEGYLNERAGSKYTDEEYRL